MLKIDGLGLYETDKDLESEEGVEVDLTDTISIRILRAGGTNRKYSRTFQRLTKPYTRQMEAGTLDDETSRRIHAEIYADSIIVGWTGMKDGDTHEPLEFNKANVMSVLLSYPDIFLLLKEKAESLDTFRRDEIEMAAEDLGNS